MSVQSDDAVTAQAEARPVFRRILLKLSGESLMGPRDHGIDRATIDAIAEEIVGVHASGVETATAVRSSPSEESFSPSFLNFGTSSSKTGSSIPS